MPVPENSQFYSLKDPKMLDDLIERRKQTVEFDSLDLGRSSEWWQSRIDDQLERREQTLNQYVSRR